MFTCLDWLDWEPNLEMSYSPMNINFIRRTFLPIRTFSCRTSYLTWYQFVKVTVELQYIVDDTSDSVSKKISFKLARTIKKTFSWRNAYNGSHAAMMASKVAEKRSEKDYMLTRTKKQAVMLRQNNICLKC